MEDISTNKTFDPREVLKQLKERFKKDKIYTFAGETLIQISSPRDQSCHAKSVSESYHLSKWREKPAHLFSVADDAYQGIIGSRGNLPENQCVILRGVSGAGKTEAARNVIRHLVTTTCENELQRKILQIPLILEAFGNAVTALNKNASRFGMYTTIYFSQGKVVGTKISEILLERWRVNNQAEGDTNFHIFYYLLAGQGFCQRMMEHRYLRNSNIVTSANITSWQSKCEAMTNAMSTIGVSNQEQADINMLLLSILSLGNITIQKSRVGEAALEPGVMEKLQNVADYLGLNSADLEESICNGDVIINGEKVQRRLTRDEAEDNRDALARMIYQRLFAWLIYRINFLLRPVSSSGKLPDREIGILDMPGFEALSNNSFEQCYYNLMDELLHEIYVTYIFRITEEECRQDGVSWPGIVIPRNQEVVDLFFMTPGGLLSTVEKETITDKSNDDTFVANLTSNLQKSRLFEPGPAPMRHLFTISHFFTKVTYDARGWLSKNQTTLSSTTLHMLQNAENTLLSTLFKTNLSSRGHLASESQDVGRKQNGPVPRSRNLSTTAHFKNAIQSVLDKIGNMNPHFVCCLKPNKTNNESEFDDQFILDQLQSFGILQAARLYSDGFFVSLDHKQFIDTYGSVVKKQAVTGNEAPADVCRSILVNSKLTGWQVGKTKVFLTGSLVRFLSDLQNLMHPVSKDEARGGEPALDSIYCLAQSVPPLDHLSIRRKSSEKYPYTRVIPKSLRDQAKKPDDKGALSEDNESSQSSDSDFEILEETFLVGRRKQIRKDEYGEIGSRKATVQWFKATQATSLKDERGGAAYIEWCHGIITRNQAEELLKNKTKGCFLIRLSETRFGYTLSFKDDKRCRHYMIEQLVNASYRIIGESSQHKSLCDLVNYYKKNKLANWNGVLTLPCGQQEGNCDYLELIITKDDEEQLNRLMNMARLEPSAPIIQDFMQEASGSLPQPNAGGIRPHLPPRPQRH